MSKVRRIYVEKRPAYAVRANELEKEFKDYLGLKGIKVRELVRLDRKHPKYHISYHSELSNHYI